MASHTADDVSDESLVLSDDPNHPANLLPAMCAKFWTLGWVPGTGGGCSIRQGDLVYIAPSAVEKELMKSRDLFVLSLSAHQQAGSGAGYLRSPACGRPSQCTPLFLAAFTRRGAGCCIHTHSHWAVLVSLLTPAAVFEIRGLEQLKGLPGPGPGGYLGARDTLRVPVIENTPQERDLAPFLEAAMDAHPDACAVLVRRHGVYVWGDDPRKAKTQCESLDYIFQLAVEMRKLGIPWVSDEEKAPS